MAIRGGVSRRGGALVKRLSRWGRFGAEAEEDVTVLCTSTSSSHNDEVLVNIICPCPEAVHNLIGLHGVGLADADKDQVVKTPSAGSAISTIPGKFILKMAEEFHGCAPM
jgi:hypothetical protein